MKVQIKTQNILLLIISISLFGCYTQLQGLDYISPSSQKEIKEHKTWKKSNKKLRNSDYEKSGKLGYNDKKYDVVEDDLYADGVYYKDYETAKWYEENYAEKIYWEGYDDGFDDGIDYGYDAAHDDFWHGYHINRHFSGMSYRNHARWRLSFGFTTHYWIFGYHFNHNNFWISSRYPIWGFDPFWNYDYYNSYYSFYNHRYNYLIIYNDYHHYSSTTKTGRVRRSGLISRGNGIQNSNIRRTRDASGSIYTKKNVRTRNDIESKRRKRDNSINNSRYTGRTKKSETNVGSRTRGTNNIRSTNRSRDNNRSSVRSRSNDQSSQRSRVRENNSSSRDRSSVRNSSSRSSDNKSTVRNNSSSSSSRSTVKSSRNNRSNSSGSSSSSKRSRSKRNN